MSRKKSDLAGFLFVLLPMAVTPRLAAASVVMNYGADGNDYMIESTTNLAATVWFTETNLLATQTTTILTNSTVSVPEKFYRLAGY